MANKRLKLISDIKTVEDLQRLKLEKKYNKDLKKLEFESSLIRLQMDLSPEAIKKTILAEGQSYLKKLAVGLMPVFLLNMFYKYKK